jgi:hypothetical protein
MVVSLFVSRNRGRINGKSMVPSKANDQSERRIEEAEQELTNLFLLI